MRVMPLTGAQTGATTDCADRREESSRLPADEAKMYGPRVRSPRPNSLAGVHADTVLDHDLKVRPRAAVKLSANQRASPIFDKPHTPDPSDGAKRKALIAINPFVSIDRGQVDQVADRVARAVEGRASMPADRVVIVGPRQPRQPEVKRITPAPANQEIGPSTPE